MSHPDPRSSYNEITLEDAIDRTMVSNCCSGKFYKDLGICGTCKEHCDGVKDEESPDLFQMMGLENTNTMEEKLDTLLKLNK